MPIDIVYMHHRADPFRQLGVPVVGHDKADPTPRGAPDWDWSNACRAPLESMGHRDAGSRSVGFSAVAGRSSIRNCELSSSKSQGCLSVGQNKRRDRNYFVRIRRNTVPDDPHGGPAARLRLSARSLLLARKRGDGGELCPCVWGEFVAMKEESSERFVQLVVIPSAPGVNVNWKNHDDKTPFDVACSSQQERDLIAEAGGLPSAGISRTPAREMQARDGPGRSEPPSGCHSGFQPAAPHVDHAEK